LPIDTMSRGRSRRRMSYGSMHIYGVRAMDYHPQYDHIRPRPSHNLAGWRLTTRLWVFCALREWRIGRSFAYERTGPAVAFYAAWTAAHRARAGWRVETSCPGYPEYAPIDPV